MEYETIFCPHCNKKMIIEKQYIGMVVQCPTCNQNFTAQTIVEKIERIKKGIPVRKIYFIAQACVIVSFQVLASLSYAFPKDKSGDLCTILHIAAFVFFIFFVISIAILDQFKINVRKVTSNLEEISVIDQKRKMLAAFFSHIRAANSLAQTVENLTDSVEG